MHAGLGGTPAGSAPASQRAAYLQDARYRFAVRGGS